MACAGEARVEYIFYKLNKYRMYTFHQLHTMPNLCSGAQVIFSQSENVLVTTILSISRSSLTRNRV